MTANHWKHVFIGPAICVVAKTAVRCYSTPEFISCCDAERKKLMPWQNLTPNNKESPLFPLVTQVGWGSEDRILRQLQQRPQLKL
jgi:hypothetical protein